MTGELRALKVNVPPVGWDGSWSGFWLSTRVGREREKELLTKPFTQPYKTVMGGAGNPSFDTSRSHHRGPGVDADCAEAPAACWSRLRTYFLPAKKTDVIDVEPSSSFLVE